METVGRPLAELLSFDGRVAIVTGAGHGLGQWASDGLHASSLFERMSV